MKSLKTTKLTSENSLIEHLPSSLAEYDAYTTLDFNNVNRQANSLANAIEKHLEELIAILLEYESYEVATDEIFRTIDLLKNLSENIDYFKLRIGAVTTFLPRNQPLYAFTCFVVVPSLMSSEVHFRIPHSMRHFLPKVLKHLDIFTLFPNIFVSPKERIEFLKERSAILLNPVTKETRPVTDAVIFTGTSVHADQLRLVFDKRTLFISNGSGHNPIVVGKGANFSDAVEATLTLSLYNQGQDCAAPNAILVHDSIYQEFMDCFYKEFSKIKIGPYHDRSCRVGPISNPEDLKHIENIIVDNRDWLDKKTGGIINTAEAIVEPTIISKPLSEGGNFEESFAPVLFIQKYRNDEELSLYFENPRYSPNAMYITLYGDSIYINKLIGKSVRGRVLHLEDTFLHNTHLHMPGIERGTQPYGGYGHGASSISIHGKITSKPTLPQRDIYDLVAKPLLEARTPDLYRKVLYSFTEVEIKNVEKILRLKLSKNDKHDYVEISDNLYFDLDSIKTENLRYVKIDARHIYHLLKEPNVEHIATLEAVDLKLIRALRALLNRKETISSDEFITELYALPKAQDATDALNTERQLHFFKNIYSLLFGKDSGPRLGSFLWEFKGSTVNYLLDV